MTTNLRWCEVDAGKRNQPAWLRSAALADDGTVFVPAAIAGETDVSLSAAYDGVTIVKYRNHVFVPSDWLKQEYRQTADLVFKIERGVREFFG